MSSRFVYSLREFHSTVEMTSYEALYHDKPSYGLSDFRIPVEYVAEIYSEQN